MPKTPNRAALATSRHEKSHARADRMLDNMHKAISHDLPNQMVALQSLLQLLNQEESDRLSDDGREYVRRLQNAARRASELVRFLKELGRLNGFTLKIETIELSRWSRELQGEMQRVLPAKEFTFEWQWHTPSLTADSRVLMQAVVELCTGFLATSGNPCRVRATSRTLGPVIELAFCVEGAGLSAPASTDRLEIILAREWLALCGADVDVPSLSGAEARFSIAVPDR